MHTHIQTLTRDKLFFHNRNLMTSPLPPWNRKKTDLFVTNIRGGGEGGMGGKETDTRFTYPKHVFFLFFHRPACLKMIWSIIIKHTNVRNRLVIMTKGYVYQKSKNHMNPKKRRQKSFNQYKTKTTTKTTNTIQPGSRIRN